MELHTVVSSKNAKDDVDFLPGGWAYCSQEWFTLEGSIFEGTNLEPLLIVDRLVFFEIWLFWAKPIWQKINKNNNNNLLIITTI